LRKQPDVYLFSVADGHGYYGAEVSGFVKSRFPSILESESAFLSNNKVALKAAVAKTAMELEGVKFDVNFSGTTFISVLLQGTKLWCANTGDSRALMARLLAD
jgi:serine/threonine protein phosphatase PrpC